ncbi:MAG: DUF5329 domain-containing protein [Pseudomonadota bacterium]|nr:DUF5329 domain-containing protein [Pseudomonadota bacterium]
MFIFALPSPCFSSESQSEIQHLLGYIEHSGCTFVRNGSESPATEARAHMEMKYDYAKKKITRAEQFIEYIAAKSSMTGRPYLVRCEGRDHRSKEWLSVELERYRNR